jgi:hypothetical protein
MKLILQQIARLLTALTALYGVSVAISLLLVPAAEPGQRLDAARAPSTLFLTEPKYVFLARSRLNTSVDKLILVGASNTLAGFKQAQVQALLPALAVHNLAVGGSNMTQIGQVVDLVREVQTPEVRRRNTYVFGLWYGLFAADKARWYTPDRHPGDTDIDIERYRYGFYRRTDFGPVPVLPPQYLQAGVLLIHPYLVLERTARDLTASLRQFMAGKRPALTDEQRNAVVLNDAQRRNYLAFWREYTGLAETLGDAPFQALERVVDNILAEGGRVVLVDLPIPDWHARGSLLAADYRRHMDELLPELQNRARVSVVRMDDADAADDFSDEVHPKPRVTGRWAQRLADELNANGRLASAAGLERQLQPAGKSP